MKDITYLSNNRVYASKGCFLVWEENRKDFFPQKLRKGRKPM